VTPTVQGLKGGSGTPTAGRKAKKKVFQIPKLQGAKQGGSENHQVLGEKIVGRIHLTPCAGVTSKKSKPLEGKDKK